MQPDEITLTVDTQNDGVDPEDQVFSRFDVYQNRSVYIGEEHTQAARDTLSFYRTFPKPTSTFKGVGKTTAKFSKDVVVKGVDGVSDITAPIIVEISFSIPVGSADALVLEMRQRAVAVLDDDDIMDELNLRQMV